MGYVALALADGRVRTPGHAGRGSAVGMREVTLTDPDGNNTRIGQGVEQQLRVHADSG